MNSQNNSTKIKMIAGVILALLGLFGLIKSPSIKRRGWRLAGFGASALAILSGYYLFVSGLDDLALGRIGTEMNGDKKLNAIVYEDQEQFKSALLGTFESQKGWFAEVRRLQFVCPDKSKSFKVFNTAFGILGVPRENVKCADGSYLVYYTKI